MTFFKDLVKDFEDTSIMEDGLHSAEFSGYVDTGSYLLNGLISADMFGGAPNNKVIAFAGDPATGKTFFSLDIVKRWMEDNPEGGVIWFDTESAVHKKMMEERGIDTRRIIISEPNTVEEFRTRAVNMLDRYMETPIKERPPMLMVLDSLGMLSTSKELSDISTDKRNKNEEAVRDMTRPGLIRGAFRALRLKLARANVALIVTCHTYAAIGSMSFEKELAGGCLVAGTKILTRNGFTNIEDVKIGDFAYTKEGEYKEVIQTFHYKKPIFEIEFEDGYVVKCSPEHKFLVTKDDGKQYWIMAKNLKETDEVETAFHHFFDITNMPLKIKSIKQHSTEDDVYDITVIDNHNYILENGVITHNSGLKYAADIILYLSKAKDKDGTEVVGNFITVKNLKNRLARENKQVTVRLSYTKGLDRYYGLADIAIELGLWQKLANKIIIGDKKYFEKEIYKRPEDFFTKEILEKCNEQIQTNYSYGSKEKEDDSESS